MKNPKRPQLAELPLAVLDQIDQICDRYERACEAGNRPAIDDYLGEIAEEHRSAMLRDLVAAEVHARRQRGERPERRDYTNRFPADTAVIAAAFAATGVPPTCGSSPPVAEANLLFGLIGLQNGLIDQDQLVSAFRAWTRDKARPLADHLVARGELDPADRVAVEALAARHLKKHGGDAEKSLAAIAAGRSTIESLAAIGDPGIEYTLAHIAAVPTEQDGDPNRTASYAIGSATSYGQRFRVLRPHARGGLGAVFVALDAELHREVALKQILEQHADDPVSRSRFLLEAEITGGLEHPGIVPVYGLGTYDDGRPYYAMRFVRGDSLKEAIERFHADETLHREQGRRSLELRKLLRRFLDVCNAIDYAHSRGVLHRDIKPGNVIVGKYGETLVVDWGLAKSIGLGVRGEPGDERPLTPSNASGSAETLPGSALGTPGFMSPEQALGDLERLGARSDVYSLGATLFCLLTGTPPYEGDDVGAVLRAVQRGAFAPPRALDPTIESSLEAVCLKAMAPKPEDRYGTPKAFADDIERWLADEPVSAYVEPLTARLGRWARRHKPTVAGAAALLVTAVVALTASTLLIGREQRLTRAAYHAESEQRAEAVTQRKRAEARSGLARRAVDDMYTQVAERWLADQPRMEQVQREFLEKARAVYEELADERDVDPVVRREAGAAYRRAGEIHFKLGQFEPAERNYRQALAIAEDLSAGALAGPSFRREQAYALQHLAELSIKTGRNRDAEECLDRSIEMLAALARDVPTDPDYRRSLAESLDMRGYLMRLIGRMPEAEGSFRRAVEIHDDLEREGHSTPAIMRTRGGILLSFGDVLHRNGRRDEAIRNFQRAISISEGLMATATALPRHRDQLAIGLGELGFVQFLHGKTAEAERNIRRAVDLWQRLADDFPQIPGHRKRLESALNRLAIIFARTGRIKENEEALRKAINLAEALVVESPAVPDLQADLIRDLGNFGNFLNETGRPREAEAILRRAIDLAERLSAGFPNINEYRVLFVALNLYNLADLLRANRRGPEAEQTYGRVIEIMESVPANTGDALLSRLIHGGALSSVGRYRLERRDFANAGQLLERARDLCRSAEKLAPGNPDPLRLAAAVAATFARTRLAMGDKAASAAAAAEAARAATDFARAAGDRPEALVEAAQLLARAAQGTGDDATQQEYNNRAVESLRQAAAKGFKDIGTIAGDPDLNSLSHRRDVQLLLMNIMDQAMPTDPFAR